MNELSVIKPEVIKPVEFVDEDNDNDYIAGLTKTFTDPIYTDHKQLQARLVQYFNRVKRNNTTPTITGMVLYLGYCSRQSFYDLAENSTYPLVSYSIKRGKQIIENWYEYGLHDNKRVTGSIFALKNMGWYDNQKIDIGLENLIKAPELDEDQINSIADKVLAKL